MTNPQTHCACRPTGAMRLSLLYFHSPVIRMISSNPLLAALWMSGAVMSFSSMALAGRAVSHELDTFELMLYRSALGLIIVLSIGRLAGTLHQISRRNLKLHLLRNASHFTGQNLWFYAVSVIPFAQVFALEFSTPLWVAVLAPVFLHEKLTRVRMTAAGIGFIGILIIVRPGTMTLSPGLLAAIFCALGFAGTYICTKLLSRKHSITCILFWLTAMQTGFGLIFAGFDGDIALPGLQTWPLVVLVACAGLLAHFCITRALQVAPAVIVAPMDFIRLPLIALIGMLFYAEPLDGWVMLGAVLVFGANLWNIIMERRHNRFPTAIIPK